MSEWRRNTDYFSEKKNTFKDCVKRIKKCLLQYFIVKDMCFVNKKAYLMHLIAQFYIKAY